MLKSKSILSFSITFVAVYLMLILPWSNLSMRYAEFYKSQALSYFEKVGKSGYLMFERADEHSTVLTVTQFNREVLNAAGQTEGINYNVDTKILAYMPCVLMIALFVATPVKFGRRALLLSIGLVILHIILMASLYIIIVYRYAHAPTLKMFIPQKSGWHFIDMLQCLVTKVTGQYSFLVICIWLGLLLIFERKNLLELRNNLVAAKAA